MVVSGPSSGRVTLCSSSSQSYVDYGLELQAVFLALQEFESVVSGQSVLVQSDNRSVVAYIVHQGGTLSVLVSTGSQSVAVVYSSGVHLSATHIPGEGYLMADFLSRGIFLPSVWKLETSLFQRICQVLSFPPEFDLFASLLNFQLPKYCARNRDLHAWKIDAMTFLWSGPRLFAFPPFSLLPRVLEKAGQEEAEIALIVPYWSRQRGRPFCQSSGPCSRGP